MSASTRASSKSWLLTVIGILLAIALVVLLLLYLYFFPIRVPYVLPQRIAAAQVDVGDPLLAVRSLDMDDAAVTFDEGEFAVNVSGKIIKIAVAPNAKTVVHKLKVVLSVADSKEPGKRTISADLTEIDLSTEGQVRVSYNNLPHVPIEKVSIKTREGQAPEVTAELLFARVIASVLADVLHAPLSESNPASADVQTRTKSASIRTATLAFRPDASLRLPKGYVVTLGKGSIIRVSNVAYARQPAESLTGSADLDLTVAPPTGLIFQPVTLASIGGRLQLAMDLSLQRPAFTATLKKAQGNHENKCDLSSGEIRYSSSTTSIKSAAIRFDSLAYDSTKEQGRFGFAATLDANAAAKWSDTNWEGSTTLSAKGVKLQSEESGPGLKIAATINQPLSLEHVKLTSKGSSDKIRLSLDHTSFTGSVDNLLVAETCIKNFTSSGGQFTYASEGLTVDASLLANANLEWHSPRPGQTDAAATFAVTGKAKPLVLSKPGVGSLSFPELDVDLRSTPGEQPGIVVSCKSTFSLQSNVVAISNASITINSLSLQSDKNGKVSGTGTAELSVPKAELAKALNAAIQKEFNVPDGPVGRILVFDGSISGCKVNAKGLSASFDGVELHIHGGISAAGRLTTSRRIVIDFPPVHRTIVNRNDFSVSAKMKGSAKVTFPSAAELVQQKADLEVHLDRPDDLHLHLSSVQFIATLLQALNSIFHFDAKVIQGLPSRVTVPLFDPNKVEASSILRRVHNPKISIKDGGNTLVLGMALSFDL